VKKPFGYGISLYIILIALAIHACGKGIEQSGLVSTRTFNYPVLKGKKENPVLRISVDGKNHGSTVKSLSIGLAGTGAGDIKALRIFYTGSDSLFSEKILFGQSVKVRKETLINGIQTLNPGTNYFWVSCEPSENADLKSLISILLGYVSLDDEMLSPNHTEGVAYLRTGVALRMQGDDGVHTFRIPGLTTTNKGTLLSIYDVRRESGRDLQGHIDIGLSRSTDGGNTWEPMRIVLDMDEWGGLPEKFNGVSDADILVDRTTGDIYVAGLWMHGVINAEGKWLEGLGSESEDWNHQWRNMGSQPGFGVRETSQFLMTKSTDDGQSWSNPVNLTKMCKKEEWWLWAPAPGHGITLEDGTLVFPTQGRDETGLPFSNITYSQDDGSTWTTSKAAYHNTTESMAVQLSDSSIMLNMRDNRNRTEKGAKNGRAVATTSDLGETWKEHETSHGALIECVCMASIHKHEFRDEQGNKKSVLFFSNPNSKYIRQKQTIKVSFDDGLTWPEKYWIELDEGKGAGYSCLTSIDDHTIGILYEGSQAHMTFQAIDIREILSDMPNHVCESHPGNG
jgi:sialidase-1